MLFFFRRNKMTKMNETAERFEPQLVNIIQNSCSTNINITLVTLDQEAKMALI